jgi:hypothetical protein
MYYEEVFWYKLRTLDDSVSQRKNDTHFNKTELENGCIIIIMESYDDGNSDLY